MSMNTDNRPFFNHFVKTGATIDIERVEVPSELRHIYRLFSWKPLKSLDIVISKADLPVFSLAVESVFVSIFFIFIPLLIVRRREKTSHKKLRNAKIYVTALPLS